LVHLDQTFIELVVEFDIWLCVKFRWHRGTFGHELQVARAIAVRLRSKDVSLAQLLLQQPQHLLG
jgi:hypothetical protein